MGAKSRFIDGPRYPRSNPILTGEIQDDFWLGFGVIWSAALNDNIINPGAQQLLGSLASGLLGGDAGTKLLDGATTWFTADASKYGADLIGVAHIGMPVRKGGRALAVAKWASILLPGYSLNGKLGFLNLPQPFSTATPQPMLPSGATSPVPMLGAGGAGTPAMTTAGAATPGSTIPPRPSVGGLVAGSRPMGW